LATLVELTPVTSAIKIIVWQSTVVVPLWDSSGVTMSSSVSGSSLQLFFPPKGAFLLLTVFLYYVHSTIYHIPHKWSSILFCYSSQQFCIALSGFVLLFLNLHKIFLHTLVSSFSWKICFCFWKVFFFFLIWHSFLSSHNFWLWLLDSPQDIFFFFQDCSESLSHTRVCTHHFSLKHIFQLWTPAGFWTLYEHFAFCLSLFFFYSTLFRRHPVPISLGWCQSH